MRHRLTAIFLLTYLAWAGVGSVFASEHVHHTPEGPVVHRHAGDGAHADKHRGAHSHQHLHEQVHHDEPGQRADRHHEHTHDERRPGHHEPRDTEDSEQSDDSSDDSEAAPKEGAERVSTPPHAARLIAPPHRAASLLAQIGQAIVPARSTLAAGELLLKLDVVFLETIADAPAADGSAPALAIIPMRNRVAVAGCNPATDAPHRFPRPPPSAASY